MVRVVLGEPLAPGRGIGDQEFFQKDCHDTNPTTPGPVRTTASHSAFPGAFARSLRTRMLSC